jgi:3-oxoacyl-[acyl-carrier protein] reductase
MTLEWDFRKGKHMAKLQNKVAVVTGASKGIGAAIAEALGKEGASVVVNYASDKAGADKVVGKITAAGGKAIAVKSDVSKSSDVINLFAETKKAYGKVDILVNNAGVYEFRPIEAVDEEHFHRQFNINVLGLLLTTKHAVALMNGDGGSIINLSSVVSLTPPPAVSVYSATKAAVDAITRSLAQELGARKIRVNSLLPGVTETEGLRANEGADKSFLDYAISRTPLGRVGTVEGIASAALFLASDDSRWVTGEQLVAGGGIRV